MAEKLKLEMGMSHRCHTKSSRGRKMHQQKQPKQCGRRIGI